MQTQDRIARLRHELQDALTRAEGLQSTIRYGQERVRKLQARLDALGLEASDIGCRRLADEIDSQLDSIAAVREELNVAVEGANELRADLKHEQSRVFDFGWEIGDIHDRQGGVALPGGSELEALEIIIDAADHGRVGTVRMKMGLSNAYARMLCNSLGRQDFIDVAADGACRLTAKGQRAMRKLKNRTSGSIR